VIGIMVLMSSFGNASCLQCAFNGLYSWLCNRPRCYWWHWMVQLSSSL